MENSPAQASRRQYASAQREHILDAAARVFTERGYDRATTKAIAAAAELSEGALYHHFTNKRELLLGVLSRVIGAVQVERAGAGGADLRERYRRAINVRVRGAHPQMRTFFALLSAILADGELAGHVRGELLQPGIDKAERALRGAIAGGAMRPVDVPAAARLVYAILLGIELLAQIGDAETVGLLEHGDRLGDTFASMMLDGLAAPNATGQG